MVPSLLAQHSTWGLLVMLERKPKTAMQEQIPWWQVDLGPEAASAAFEAVAARNLSQGPITETLEAEVARLVGSRFGIATSSGSTALTLALMAAGAKPGDRVICPAYTWVATAQAAQILGCSVELVDIEPDRPVMDINQVPDASDERIFAIPVHMNGHSTDVTTLREKGYTVIEDAAQALGSVSEGRMLGTLGHLGCYSFSVSKIIGSGQGGIVVTDSEELVSLARRARTHGVVDVFAPEAWQSLGHNFRFNDVLAAVLLTQIPRLTERLDYARHLAGQYRQHLHSCEGVEIVRHSTGSEVGPYIEARVSRIHRDKLVEYLNNRGIGARKAFPPLSSANYMNPNPSVAFPNSSNWSAEVLYLPSGPGLSTESLEKVCKTIQTYFGE